MTSPATLYEIHHPQLDCPATRELAAWQLAELFPHDYENVDDVIMHFLQPSSDEHRHLRLVTSEEIIAIASLNLRHVENTGTALLLTLFVRDGFRGRGFGSTLLRQVEAEAANFGAAMMGLFAWPLAEDVRPFYRRAGYRRRSADSEFELAKRLPSKAPEKNN